MSVIALTAQSAQDLIIAADFSVRDSGNDVRAQSLTLMSIAISLNRIADGQSAVPARTKDIGTLKEIWDFFDQTGDGAEGASYSNRMANRFAEPLQQIIQRLEKQ